MASDKLQRRIKDLQDDFRAETGSEFTHFFCPILHTDEPVEIVIDVSNLSGGGMGVINDEPQEHESRRVALETHGAQRRQFTRHRPCRADAAP